MKRVSILPLLLLIQDLRNCSGRSLIRPGICIAPIILLLIALFGCVPSGFDTSESIPTVTPNTRISEMEVGACFDRVDPGGSLTTVPCNKPHYMEVFALIPYPSGENDSYPGSIWLYTYTGDQCIPYFEAYTGLDYTRSEMGIIITIPDAEQWALGEREIACSLMQPTGSSPLYERIAGSMRAGWSGSWPHRRSPDTPAGPEAALLGNWTATDSVTGTLFLLHLRPEGTLSIVYFGDLYALGGEYEWVNNDAIRLSFRDWTYGEEEKLCAHIPAFLKSVCHTRVVDPASYPGMDPTLSLPPSNTAGSTGPPYPAPPFLPRLISHIDDVFEVAVGGNTLALTHSSGIVQNFHRLDE